MAGIAVGVAASSGDALGQTPTCFGAAARDPDRLCSNVAQRHSVTPTPQEARELPNSPCRPLERRPSVCGFGARAGAMTVALVGDSHVGHWRAAVDHVAQVKGWRGLSITHSSCPLQKALRDLPEPRRTSCARWKDEVFAWFARHPEVSTVFVGGLTGSQASCRETDAAGSRRQSRVTRTRGGRCPDRDADRRDPRHAEGPGRYGRVRDPRRHSASASGDRVRGLESIALERDPAMTAAARLDSPRVASVDLTRFFCGARCYPVVGGALVLRDSTHMTGAFSGTLGPVSAGRAGVYGPVGIGARSLTNPASPRPARARTGCSGGRAGRRPPRRRSGRTRRARCRRPCSRRPR